MFGIFGNPPPLRLLTFQIMLRAFAQVVSMAGTRVALEQLGRKEFEGVPLVRRPPLLSAQDDHGRGQQAGFGIL